MFENFNLDKIKLSDKYFSVRRETAKKYVNDFDINRLMHTFRKNAGIESLAEPLGGWESEECNLRGHFVGHFLSACSKFAFSDNDDCLKTKADNIVKIMAECASENGYLSAFGEEMLDILETEEDRGVWAPYYTLHKILQGLVDCYLFLNNKTALSLAVNLAHYIRRRFERLSYWKTDGILRCTRVNPVNEFGGIGDVLYSLYEITGDRKIFDLADIFNRDYFIGNLAADRDVLEDLHANTHLPMVISAIHRFNLTGEYKYKHAAQNFYKYLLGRTFVNGNSSSKATSFKKGEVSEKSEHWGAHNHLENSLTGGESESCCAHNTEKIVQQLFAWTEDERFLEHLEILKYNAVLNSTSTVTGLSQYQQPMGTGVKKNFSGLFDTFWCCTGTGIEAMSEIQKNIWFKDKDTLLLNMFIASTVQWDEKNVKIVQNTAYPDNTVSVLTVSTSNPVSFTLMLRKSQVKSVKINGKSFNFIADNGYIYIKRIFNNNDTIEIEIDSSLHLIQLKGSENKAAVMYDRILLAQLGQKPYLDAIDCDNVNQRLIKAGSPLLSFKICDNEDGCTEFIPLFRVEDEIYSVYHSFSPLFPSRFQSTEDLLP
ncbi:beta-L-arabinofuranosidase domain-containing protein [Ruminiclostridium cellulolyticum]|uniref:Uncharacterized protein n=1 Tax=Ruminiclostridium cellulolyticum (strain ATCC 35319 / DSM 5812 / JCM 6584 / H10) TaxID=394503 RepID=B8I999_RUMCH|nr:beta-L-arabinofuranosidase domain-containing protein [Ruminiclostridium cellulolyticum]ACL75359.1 protein of unknown function DUF1680 [Ruminiclostridium cellulolyticum H10]